MVRGVDDKGAPVARCASCHGVANDPATGIPGAPNWHLAPLTMAWESQPGIPMTGPDLCAMLKDRLKNGDRSLEDLLVHLKEEPLVKWAFAPGTRWNGDPRSKPPITQDELVKSFEGWMNEGAPCPLGDS